MANPKNYDSEFCGRVPLHQTNLIQPHGVLMIVQKENFIIIQVSENIEALVGKAAPMVANTAFTDYIPAEQAQNLKNRFAGNTTGKIPFTFTLANVDGSKEHLALVHSQKDFLIIEFEKEAVSDEQNSFISVYQELKYVISAIEAAVTIEEASAIIVQELKRISGFDKIMIYEFDADWNGTVIAEVMEPGMDPYLGLKFPASDIPKQAREMYRKSPYRLIPDRDYQPVRLYPVINPATNAFTDLSESNLRSVAAVHVEYLRNMHVTASMSTRIINDDALWGLIACHHRTPKYLSYQMCSLFELLSNIISAKVAALQHQVEFKVKSDLHQQYSKVVENLYKTNNLLEGFQIQHEQLLALLNAEGLAIAYNKQVRTYGLTPTGNEVEDLVYWLQTNGIQKSYQDSSLSGSYENAELYATEASGLLALPIQPDKGNFILAFRPEAVRNVTWGGNPNEAIQFEPDRKNYHPRNSFKQWQETVKKTAVPWTKAEMEIAENFRNFVVEYTLNKM